MAYNYIGLTNDILNKMNEVPLNSGNFAGATGFYSDAKNSVNSAISAINRVAWQWPFNHKTKILPLVIDQVRYPLEPDTKNINWNSFRIKGDTSQQVVTRTLWSMDYEDYMAQASDMEYRPDIYHAIPEVVFRCPDLSFGVVPPPDKTYDLIYEYYSLPSPLVNPEDVPTIPEFFRWVVNDGSFAQAFRFRGDLEMAADYQQRFQDGIEEMRTIFINRTDYITSTMNWRR